MLDYIMSFLVGGLMCLIVQIIIDKTSITPGVILVSLVTLGVILGAFNIYDIVIRYGRAGATVPLPGFGNSLAKSTIKEVKTSGLIGAFTGGIKGTAGGITSSIFFGYIMALIFNSKTKG